MSSGHFIRVYSESLPTKSNWPGARGMKAGRDASRRSTNKRLNVKARPERRQTIGRLVVKPDGGESL